MNGQKAKKLKKVAQLLAIKYDKDWRFFYKQLKNKYNASTDRR